MNARPDIVLIHEIPSGHLAMVSHPGDVARLITTAAEAVPATG
jgi:hypothetical protein